VENQIEAVRVLIESGSDVNTVSRVGGTPLSEAAYLGYEELVGLLLEAGAELHLEGLSEPTIHEAAISGNVQVMMQILRAGATPDEPNSLRETALHVAAASDNRVDALRALLNAGADQTKRWLLDQTPLDVAVSRGSEQCAALLRSYLRSPNIDPKLR
jgi:ankyrin repeat protein